MTQHLKLVTLQVSKLKPSYSDTALILAYLIQLCIQSRPSTPC